MYQSPTLSQTIVNWSSLLLTLIHKYNESLVNDYCKLFHKKWVECVPRTCIWVLLRCEAATCTKELHVPSTLLWASVWDHHCPLAAMFQKARRWRFTCDEACDSHAPRFVVVALACVIISQSLPSSRFERAPCLLTLESARRQTSGGQRRKRRRVRFLLPPTAASGTGPEDCHVDEAEEWAVTTVQQLGRTTTQSGRKTN